LRRLNQRKADYLSSLNRLKEKAIRSNFPLDMTNDMIAMASNWEEILRPPKCDKKDDPKVWATSLPHLIFSPNSNRERQKVKSEGNDNQQKN